jgi:hypothetical protein
MECRPRGHYPEGHAARADGSLTIKDGAATQVKDLPSDEAHRASCLPGNTTIIVQFDVEKALAAYQIRDNRLLDMGERLKLAPARS